MSLLVFFARLVRWFGAACDRVGSNIATTSTGCDECSQQSEPATEQPALLDESRCHLLLTETGLAIPGWATRILAVALGLATPLFFVLAAGLPVGDFSGWERAGFALASGFAFLLLMLVAARRIVVTETSAKGFWPFLARHANGWLQLAGPRYFSSLLALFGALLAATLGTRIDTTDFDQAIWSNVAASLGVVSGAAILATLYEYPRQFRNLRREAMPTILALQLGYPVDPHEVSRFFLSLERGVAGLKNSSIGLVDASRARIAVAIYTATRSPSVIAPIVDEAARKLGLNRRRSERLYARLANRDIQPGSAVERNTLISLAGHPRATAQTWNLLFEWINDSSDRAAPLKGLRESWSAPQR